MGGKARRRESRMTQPLPAGYGKCPNCEGVHSDTSRERRWGGATICGGCGHRCTSRDWDNHQVRGDIAGTPITGTDSASWQAIPELIQGALTRYFEHRLPPGSFTRACLSGDFRTADTLGDEEAVAAMGNVARWLCRHGDEKAFGTKDRVDRWLAGREVA